MTLTVLGSTGQTFCRISLSWGLSLFPVSRWSCGGGEEDHRGQAPFSSHHYLQGTWALLLTLVTGWGSACQGASTAKSFFSSSSTFCPLWKEVSLQSPHLRSGGLCSFSLRWRSYINYLDLFFIQESCFFSLSWLSSSKLITERKWVLLFCLCKF